MLPEKAVQTVEQQAWLDSVSDGVQPAVHKVFEAGGPTGQHLATSPSLLLCVPGPGRFGCPLGLRQPQRRGGVRRGIIPVCQVRMRALS